jgi:hypothetical protein
MSDETSAETPTLATLIDQQMKVVDNLQKYAAYGENGSQACREYGMALSGAIDKLATLKGLDGWGVDG